jgi:hypothetical protein
LQWILSELTYAYYSYFPMYHINRFRWLPIWRRKDILILFIPHISLKTIQFLPNLIL